jgi:uncharacterized membrane protein (DUF4010 family)
MATQARESPKIVIPAAVAILAASATMFGRILAIVGIVDFKPLPILMWPLGVMMIAGYGIAAAFYLRSRDDRHEAEPVSHRNPFELGSALKFGLLYASVIFVAKAAQTFLGDRGLYISSVLAGTTDVDPITLSVARFHREGLGAATAAVAITLAAVTNTVVKAGIAAWLGGQVLAVRVTVGMGVMLVAGALALVLR